MHPQIVLHVPNAGDHFRAILGAASGHARIDVAVEAHLAPFEGTLASLVQQGKALYAFGRDSWREVKKVVWPARKEAIQMTAYVFVFVLVMALFLWLTDKTLEWLFYDLILGWKK